MFSFYSKKLLNRKSFEFLKNISKADYTGFELIYQANEEQQKSVKLVPQSCYDEGFFPSHTIIEQ